MQLLGCSVSQVWHPALQIAGRVCPPTWIRNWEVLALKVTHWIVNADPVIAQVSQLFGQASQLPVLSVVLVTFM